MHRPVILLLALALPFSAWAAEHPSAQRLIRGEYVHGELLVKYRESEGERVSRAPRTMNMVTVKRFERLRVERLRLPKSMTVEEGMALLSEDPDIEYVEPNYVRRGSMEPNDPLFGLQWALHNTGQSVNGVRGTIDADIDAPAAWGLETGSDVVIAVIDSGVDYSHSELAANMWSNAGEELNGEDTDGNGFVDDVRGWDFVDHDNDPTDQNGHGTSVASVIAAHGDNGMLMAGVCWRARIMPVRFLNAGGAGSVDGAISAIEYAVRNGARVINASYGGTAFSRTELEAIQAAGEAGVLFVAAAGNRGVDLDAEDNTLLEYPAAYGLANIISVGATTQNDGLTGASNHGKVSTHVGAPGQNLVALGGAGYKFVHGTSFSAAYVSGLAGLLISRDNELTALEVRQRIINGVDRPMGLNGKHFSDGRINASRSLRNIPAVPSGMTATSGPPETVQLRWADNYLPEGIGFQIERRSGTGSSFVPIVDLVEYATEYLDEHLEPGVDYEYRMRAFNGENYSEYAMSGINQAEELGVSGGGGGGGGCTLGVAHSGPGQEWVFLGILLFARSVGMAQRGRWKKRRL